MGDKIARFLKSVHLEDESLDLDFDFCAWDLFDPKLFNMQFCKQTPWDYASLSKFLDALSNLPYRHFVTYRYAEEIAQEDVLRLVGDYYFATFNVAFLYPYQLEEDRIVIHGKVGDERIEKDIAKCNEFLKSIGYPLLTLQLEELVEEKEEDVIDEEWVPSMEEELEEETEEERVARLQQIRREAVEDILEDGREDLRKAEKEQENARLFAQYKHIIIANIDANIGNVDFDAKLFSLETRKTKKGKWMANLGLADQSSAIYGKLFEKKDLPGSFILGLKVGERYRIRGKAEIDAFSQDLVVSIRQMDLLPSESPRTDEESEKRVELHLHTKMSTMDGVSTIKDYCRVASAMGHRAIAVTDHGVAQSFPIAQSAAAKAGIHMIYGCEFYMIEDQLHAIRNPSPIQLNNCDYVVFDFETTGLSMRYDDIIEFGAVRIEKGIEVDRKNIYVNIHRPLPKKIKDLTGISDETLKRKGVEIREAMEMIRDFIKDACLVSHNIDFDYGFLNETCRKLSLPYFTNPAIDTLALSRYLYPDAKNHRLGTLCNRMQVEYDEEQAHSADYDASVLNEVWQAMLSKLTKDHYEMRHDELKDLKISEDHLKHLRPSHVIALVKNSAGLKDLYRLISFSHIDFLAEVPKIPRSYLEKYRENLLLGSACFNGEIFDAARTKSRAQLLEKAKFYDYLEVQPPENYSYLVHMGEMSEEQVIRAIHDIIDVADELGKPVVATGDVHYANPEDKKFRDVFIYAKGNGGVNHPMMPYSRQKEDGDIPYFENPDQHYRSTKEMLDAFSFLGEEKAREIVIKNTNRIADCIGEVKPVKDKLYVPKIDNSEKLLSDLCYQTAHEVYGDPLPKVVADRLEQELKGIIGSGYSVTYYIAYKIIKKANEDGYMVGSRGSVGSSFAATMAKITEVNPLPPHYHCPKCKFTEFPENPGVTSGFDLPEKKCPKCGCDMIHDGQDIPFATFLGFNADKVPDIDLNFPGDYQPRAHLLTKDLLGADNVFKAGTIETVADKTAFGYAKGYFERVAPRLGIDLASVSKAEIAYLATGCTDVKRTTGQHPGGIVVIPRDMEVFDFTPIQYPADDKDSAWKTTHFDFHVIHDNVLKLDLLGHVDPLALKMMADTTGIDVLTIPLNDPETLSLFSSGEALHRHANYLKETTGALGLPEFGTNMGRRMLEETHPTTFADLLAISGLSHGTDVWAGNAETLIQNGTCTIKEVIGCRDDIMTFLMKKGVEPLTSFKIMEDVRHGKGLKEEYVAIMKEKDVPDWYIDSCNKIKYMFPKAHATAYVTMALRVGWFKVHRPLEFYATFFTVRCRQYDLKIMLAGEKAIIAKLEEIKGKGFDASQKEVDLEKTLTIALEMEERGYHLENIDLYKSDATKFLVDKETNKIMCPFVAIDGLGESAANSIVEARKDGDFLSKEDLLKRTKITLQNMEKLEQLHVLDSLADTDQMDLFSFNFS